MLTFKKAGSNFHFSLNKQRNIKIIMLKDINIMLTHTNSQHSLVTWVHVARWNWPHAKHPVSRYAGDYTGFNLHVCIPYRVHKRREWGAIWDSPHVSHLANRFRHAAVELVLILTLAYLHCVYWSSELLGRHVPKVLLYKLHAFYFSCHNLRYQILLQTSSPTNNTSTGSSIYTWIVHCS